MPQVHEVTTYTIDEHPDKERVYKYVRENWHDLYAWEGENIDSLKAFCEHFNLKLIHWELSLCSYSYVVAQVPDDLEGLVGVRLWKYLNNNGLLHNGLLSGNCPFTGYCMDENLLDPIRAFMKKPDTGLGFQGLIDECLDAWVKAYIADWEYAYSDEGIHEHLQANEYQFTEEGSLWA